MANFTAADVKKLRDLTGAGMMDCKKALDESDGDFDKAVEFLRIKGAKDVGKRAGRTAANGLVAHSGNALLELNCETDFVAKNADFVALAQQLVEHGEQAKPADADGAAAPRRWPTAAPSPTLIQELSAKIGEKLVVNRFAVLDGTVAVYLHRKSAGPAAAGRRRWCEYTGKTDEAGDADARGVGDADRRDAPEVPDPRRGAGRGRRVRAAHRRADRPRGGQARGGPAEDRRGPGELLLQGLRPAGAGRRSPTRRRRSSRSLAEAGIEVTRFVRFEVGQA